MTGFAILLSQNVCVFFFRRSYIVIYFKHYYDLLYLLSELYELYERTVGIEKQMAAATAFLATP